MTVMLLKAEFLCDRCGETSGVSWNPKEEQPRKPEGWATCSWGDLEIEHLCGTCEDALLTTLKAFKQGGYMIPKGE